MAIYIKGVEMPKHRAIDLTITPDGSAIIWGTTHRLLDEKCTYIPEAMKEEALCHEILHGIFVHIGYEKDAENEQYVQFLAQAINQSFKVRGSE